MTLYNFEFSPTILIIDVPSDDVEPTDCSFEKYYNRTFIYAESSIEGSLEDCQKMCFDEDSFYCRGISYITKTKMCFLHSDDIASFSNLSLVHSYGAVYMRRVECLNGKLFSLLFSHAFISFSLVLYSLIYTHDWLENEIPTHTIPYQLC